MKFEKTLTFVLVAILIAASAREVRKVSVVLLTLVMLSLLPYGVAPTRWRKLSTVHTTGSKCIVMWYQDFADN